MAVIWSSISLAPLPLPLPTLANSDDLKLMMTFCAQKQNWKVVIEDKDDNIRIAMLFLSSMNNKNDTKQQSKLMLKENFLSEVALCLFPRVKSYWTIVRQGMLLLSSYHHETMYASIVKPQRTHDGWSLDLFIFWKVVLYSNPKLVWNGFWRYSCMV